MPRPCPYAGEYPAEGIGVLYFMGYLEGKSSIMLYEQFGELKYKYRNREFWCRGYYVDTVGKTTALLRAASNRTARL